MRIPSLFRQKWRAEVPLTGPQAAARLATILRPGRCDARTISKIFEITVTLSGGTERVSLGRPAAEGLADQPRQHARYAQDDLRGIGVTATEGGFQLQMGSPDALPVSVVMSPQQSVIMLLCQVASGQSGGWRGWPPAATVRALRPAARFAARSFAAPSPTVIPECSTPIPPLADVPVAEQADRLRDLPPGVLTDQLRAGHGGHPYPPQYQAAAQQPGRWLASLADASLDTWAAIRPRWKAAGPLFDREVRRVGTAVVRGGMDALLNSLHPRIGYANGVLTFAHSNRRHMALGGRRLVLLPMIANRDAASISGEHPEIFSIAYPVRPPGPLPRAGASQGLALILGPLRAAALEALGRPLTVGEVAAAVQCAPTTATYHLQQMAKADLISRQRHGTSIRVTRTLRGDKLVDLLSG